ncbi:MAG: glycoside hydrolase 100 family protein [bacterium]|nr:glycoside hydrolase 100 family protein [bacterium]
MILEETYAKSAELLKSLSTSGGLLASIENIDNYRRVWSRDGVVAGIASILSGDAALIKTFKQTLFTLKKYQDRTGRVPSNVSVENGDVSYGTTVGRIDATLWYVIGVCNLVLKTGDGAVWDDYKESVEKAVFYLECLELNGRGLIYIPQGGDWADEYINHGYVLYDELLYYLALRSFSLVTNNPVFISKKDYLKELILVNYFPDKKYLEDGHVYHRAMYESAMLHYNPPLPVTYFSNHSVRFHLDVFAVGLLLLSDILSAKKKEEVRAAALVYCGVDLDGGSALSVLPAFHPVISEGDHNWEHLRSNHLYEFKNKPYHYHNGGRWPLVHGFFLASNLSQKKEEHLSSFAEVLAKDSYSFPEFYDGETGEAKGIKGLGFSAAAFLLAYEAAINGKKVFE